MCQNGITRICSLQLMVCLIVRDKKVLCRNKLFFEIRCLQQKHKWQFLRACLYTVMSRSFSVSMQHLSYCFSWALLQILLQGFPLMQDFNNVHHFFLFVARTYLKVCSTRNFTLLDLKSLIMLLSYSSKSGSENSCGKMQETVNINILSCKRPKFLFQC